ncbi:hypothetical protein EC9_41220 [Rosistilla ulvae]|uniref:Uncharacterized protein n=1 Tax=Rosistilla ulvae TaxID=1930277 RepID=A0A517M4X7_9BACT|nr:hypothetical protein EC9_41220 [Rosistilla ulvae]
MRSITFDFTGIVPFPVRLSSYLLSMTCSYRYAVIASGGKEETKKKTNLDHLYRQAVDDFRYGLHWRRQG